MNTLWIVLIIALTALSCGHIGYMIGVVRTAQIYAGVIAEHLEAGQ